MRSAAQVFSTLTGCNRLNCYWELIHNEEGENNDCSVTHTHTQIIFGSLRMSLDSWTNQSDHCFHLQALTSEELQPVTLLELLEQSASPFKTDDIISLHATGIISEVAGCHGNQADTLTQQTQTCWGDLLCLWCVQDGEEPSSSGGCFLWEHKKSRSSDHVQYVSEYVSRV